MAGEKTLINATDKQLEITLLVRQGENPRYRSESRRSELDPRRNPRYQAESERFEPDPRRNPRYQSESERFELDPRRNPRYQSESERVELSPQEEKSVSYGNPDNIYLDGLSIVAIEDGEATTKQEFTVNFRGDLIDRQLNTNSVIEISRDGDSFTLNAYN